MEFNSLKELYIKLIPAFNVKKRFIINSKYKNITNENIWQYLTATKWKNSKHLSLSEMTNDIIIANIEDIYRYTEE